MVSKRHKKEFGLSFWEFRIERLARVRIATNSRPPTFHFIQNINKCFVIVEWGYVMHGLIGCVDYLKINLIITSYFLWQLEKNDQILENLIFNYYKKKTIWTK